MVCPNEASMDPQIPAGFAEAKVYGRLSSQPTTTTPNFNQLTTVSFLPSGRLFRID